MKYRIILYLFLLGITAALYFIELESIFYSFSRVISLFLEFSLVLFISMLFKLIAFLDKDVSFILLLKLSVTEIMVTVLYSIGIYYGGITILFLPLYLGTILVLFYSFVDKSDGIFSNVFRSLLGFHLILFIVIFFGLAYELSTLIRIM